MIGRYMKVGCNNAVILSDLGILRFAKMRLERIEKMGVEMIEILPQAKLVITPITMSVGDVEND